MSSVVTRYAVSQASTDERATFIARTYTTLLGALIAFTALEYALFASGLALPIAQSLLGSRFGWLLVLGGAVGVSYLANNWAMNQDSQAKQWMGLGLYIVMEVIIFAPLLVIAAYQGPPGVIQTAAIYTLVLFGGLTGVVFFTRKDFSFMRGILLFAGFAAMALIAGSIIFGFTLGVIFSWAMLFLAGGYVLYHTSNVLHHYKTHQHVAAALSLFASIMLLFWYVLRILMRSRR